MPARWHHCADTRHKFRATDSHGFSIRHGVFRNSSHPPCLSWSMSSIRSLLSPSQGSSISAQRSALADPSRRNVGFSSPHAPHEFWSEAATIIMFKVENVPERLWSPSGMCNQAECMGSKRRDASGELIPNSGAQCSMTRRLDSFVGSAY
jgi:hypothetical protein